MSVEEQVKKELKVVKEDLKKLRENELVHIENRISDLERVTSSSIKRVLPFISIVFVVTLIGLFAIFYGFAYDVWSAIWGGLGTIAIVMVSIFAIGRKR